MPAARYTRLRRLGALLLLLFAAAVPAAAQPDLSMKHYGLPSTAPGFGSSVALQYELQNTGTAAAGAFVVRFYYDDDATLNLTSSTTVLLAEVNVPGLAAGAATGVQAVTVTLPKVVLFGLRNLHYVIDATNTVGEPNETNNKGHATIDITGRPDVRVDALTLNPTTMQAGQAFTASYRVINSGLSRVPGNVYVYFRFYYSADGVIDPAVDTALPATSTYTQGLDAGAAVPASGTSNVTLELPGPAEPGARFIGLLTDEGDRVVEADESNNIRTVAITALPSADLRMRVFTPPATARGFNTVVPIAFEVENAGALASPATKAHLVYDDNTSYKGDNMARDLADLDVPALVPGAVFSGTFDVTLPSAVLFGTRYLHYFLDPTDAINEIDEPNNKGYAALEITGKPDLVVDSVAVTPASQTAGGAVGVRYRLRNAGYSRHTTNSYVRVHYSADAVLDGTDVVLTNGVTVGSMLAGEYHSTTLSTHTTTVPTTAAPGTRYIALTTDPANAVAEEDDANNTRFGPFTVTGGIDLAMHQFAVPASALGYGSTIPVTYDVRNIGTIAAGASKMRLYYADGPTLNLSVGGMHRLLAEVDVPALAPGASFTGTRDVALPGTVLLGERRIHYVLDATALVGESDEANNRNAAPIQITGLPDLRIDSLSVTPSTQDAGGALQVRSRVVNAGYSRTASDVYMRFYYSETGQVAGATPLGGSAFRMDAVNAGEVKPTPPTISVYSFTLPVTANPGVHAILSRIDDTSIIGEGDETNNVGSTPITVLGAADLAMKAFGAPERAAGFGTTITASFEVENRGGAPADTFAVRFYYNDDTSLEATERESPVLAEVVFPGLALGATTGVQTVALPLPDRALFGARRLHYRIDPANRVTELNEANNTGHLPLQVTGRPELSVQLFNVSPPDRKPGEAINATYRLVNSGPSRVDVANFNAQFFFSEDDTLQAQPGGDALLASLTLDGLAAAATYPASGTNTRALTIPDSAAVGTGRIFLRVDGAGVVTEADETNNTALATFHVEAGADLVLKTFNVPTSANGSGSTVDVSFSVENLGVSPAPASRIRFFYDDNTVAGDGDVRRLLAETEVPAVAPGSATASLAAALTLPADVLFGSRFIHYTLDADSAVAETNEANNRGSKPLAVTGKPNLVFTAFRALSAAVQPGAELALRFAVANTGASRVPAASAVRFYYSADSTLTTADPYLNREVVLPVLPAGALYPADGTATRVAVTVPATAALGARYAGAILDVANAVAEASEADNTAKAGFIVGDGAPDLTMVANAFVAPSSAAGAGTAIAIRYNVTNAGSTPAPASVLRFYYDDDDTLSLAHPATRQLGPDVAVPALAVGARTNQLTVQAVLPPSVLLGSRRIHYVLDAAGAVAESNEENNAGRRALTITGKPDLRFDSLAVAPSTVAPGGAATFTYRVRNAGFSRVDAPARLEALYSEDNVLQAADPVLAADTLAAGLEAGARFPEGNAVVSLPATLPATAQPGTRYAGIRLDATAAVSESDEANNTVLRAVTVGAPPTASLTVTSPVASSAWALGSTQTITWTSTGLPASEPVRLQLKKRGAWTATIAGSTPNDGSFAWVVPDTLATGAAYQVRLMTQSQVVAQSEVFSISAPTTPLLVVSSPARAAVWQPGASYDVTWRSYNVAAAELLQVKLLPPSGTALTLTTSTENDGTFRVTVPADLAPGASYRLRLVSRTNAAVYAYSAYFTVGAPGLTAGRVAGAAGDALAAVPPDTLRRAAGAAEAGADTLAAFGPETPEALTGEALAAEAAAVAAELAADLAAEHAGAAPQGTETAQAAGAATSLPTAYALTGNYPNPFNPETTIGYELPEAVAVRLEVFDVLGRRVSVLVEDVQPAGRHAVRFEAAALPSGTYLYRLQAGAKVFTGKMLLVK